MDKDSIENDFVYENIDIQYGVQIIFSTIPNQKEIDFETDVEKNYFEDYKDKIENKDIFLYRPLKFYMLGDYDVCYITLINNFKFSHRLFEPKGKPDETVYNAHSFQSYSGFALNESDALKNIFANSDSTYFTGVINLKLNNGLLIGNGLKYIEAVYNYIKLSLVKTPFIVTQTFSWFELSLVVFINDPSELANILSKLRLAEFKDLNNFNDLNNSLYHSLIKGKRKKTILNTSLFADTHTYFGFNQKLITTRGLSNSYIKEFEKHIKKNNIELETEIEWQVKPGHITELENLLQEHTYLRNYFKFDKRKVVLGKCDFLLQEVGNDIMSNFHLIRYLHRKKDCNLFYHIRKVRTYIFLNGDKVTSKAKREDIFCWDEELDKLAVNSKDFHEIDKKLKALKISRQVRIKILKIFSNYNNGIQDPIQFPYFLDFTIFIKNLKILIKEEYDISFTKVNSIRELEIKLNEHIKVFQEGYNVRFLNGYQFENISDFDLDFNSSIQQLLTTYGTLVYEYGKLFYKDKTKPYGPLIQLNNIDTTSNYRSINYSIHHLTSPEFVFSTLLKEILNHLKIDNSLLSSEFGRLNNALSGYLEDINESYLDDMFENQLIDLDYLIIDSIRFIITFNCNFKLFEHWFWSYNFQNPSLFDTSGMFNEEHLRKEMLRIKLLQKIFNVKDELNCPIVEIHTYWERHQTKIDKIAEDIVSIINNFKFVIIIQSLVQKYLDNYKNVLNLDNNVMDYMYKMDGLSNIPSEIKDKQLVKLSFLFNNKLSREVDVLHIDKMMFNTLHEHAESNNNKVTLLKRNWKTGSILSVFNNNNKDILYAIDQTGGVYFYENNKINNYFKSNASCLLSLINFSFIKKKDFILEHQNNV
jgi:hypothetical protein